MRIEKEAMKQGVREQGTREREGGRGEREGARKMEGGREREKNAREGAIELYERR